MELDQALVGKALKGDRAAFQELVEQLWAPVFLFVRGRINDRERARDLTQDTFLQAYSKRATVRKGESFLSWVFTIASRKVIDCYRKQGNDLTVYGYDSAPGEVADPGMSPLRSLEQQEDAALVRAGLQKLHDRYRAVLILRYWSGLTPGQISRLLQEPEGTIRNRIFRAHGHLRRILDQEQPTATPQANLTTMRQTENSNMPKAENRDQ